MTNRLTNIFIVLCMVLSVIIIPFDGRIVRAFSAVCLKAYNLTFIYLPQESWKILTSALPPFQHIHQKIGLVMKVEGEDRQQIALVTRLHLRTVSEIWLHCLRTAEIRHPLDLLLWGNNICLLSRQSNFFIYTFWRKIKWNDDSLRGEGNYSPLVGPKCTQDKISGFQQVGDTNCVWTTFRDASAECFLQTGETTSIYLSLLEELFRLHRYE